MAVASTAPVHSLAHYRTEFPIFERRIYLNSCSLGALSLRSRRRVQEYLTLWEERGAPAWYDVWWDALDTLRREYARVIAAKPEEIALHASVSTASAVLAGAIDYTGRPKVVTTELDFPTVAYQWLAKRDLGIEVEVVPSPDGVTVPVEALAAAIDERTALVATSHVFFTTGAIQDIKAVAEAAHARGALCFVDAYQSAGQLPLDVYETGVDSCAPVDSSGCWAGRGSCSCTCARGYRSSCTRRSRVGSLTLGSSSSTRPRSSGTTTPDASSRGRRRWRPSTRSWVAWS